MYPVLVKEYESKIHKLIASLSKKDRLEASGIQLFQDYYYVVFDNLSSIAKLHVSLDKKHPDNILIPGPEPLEQFEDITYSTVTQRFYVVIENAEVEQSDATQEGSTQETVVFKPIIREYNKQLNLLEMHFVDYVFTVENKGLEGLAAISRNNQEYLIGLCEAAGDNSTQKTGAQNTGPAEQGVGSMLVLKKNTDRWHVDQIIHLPQSVQFGDYAALDVRDNRIAVVSQVSSALWVGQFKEQSWEFVDEGNIYLFPRSKTNALKYCNVEGVTWVDHDTIAVVSDKRKSIDSKRCKKKDQSIQLFKIPV
jgi:hypothetical protein